MKKIIFTIILSTIAPIYAMSDNVALTVINSSGIPIYYRCFEYKSYVIPINKGTIEPLATKQFQLKVASFGNTSTVKETPHHGKLNQKKRPEAISFNLVALNHQDPCATYRANNMEQKVLLCFTPTGIIKSIVP